ncbi:FAD-dependent oxidoreductase [Leptobacterium flavescens]|uniref:FAD-dependent oxidoreductase n=1 Tax=Leptobacterium flavescens TaxID=472055 RepID=A0A6P0UL44_9FLAO|nr:NAD(P)/FAD-dependent oxidoreductase [Leptobacterium flavescens]NER12599.1 FAD-dependent oxidoreductase [Leptobacterium flavescens]
MNELSSSTRDVVIIGGGPAGMSAALVLGRSRINTIILNTEKARNLVTTHSHGFLTQDGKHPSEIFSIAKKQLEKYPSVTYKKEKALSVEKTTDGFLIKTNSGSYRSRRVILATGYKDNIRLLEINGLSEVYGTSVYPCPFCDGFEMADKKLGVFGDAQFGPMFSKTIAHWSKDIIVFTNGDKVTDTGLIKNLKLNGIEIVDKKIKELVSTDGHLKQVVFTDHTAIEREGGFIADTKSTESVDFARKLNIPTEEGYFGIETYKVDENKETDVKGFYIIGDARTGWSGVASSVAEGSEVAAAITHQIIEENWRH